MPRFAVYYAPETDDPLWHAGCAWVGRDAESGTLRPQPLADTIASLTASPRRYGFHATLKPPMRLAPGMRVEDFTAGAQHLARSIGPFAAPPLRIGLLDGFLAILQAEPHAALRHLADRVVTDLDQFRAPPDAGELARRHPETLDARERDLLARYGYPYVLERWRFHMTLSERLDDETASILSAKAEAHFAAALARPRRIASIALCAEAAPGADFRLIERIRLSGA